MKENGSFEEYLKEHANMILEALQKYEYFFQQIRKLANLYANECYQQGVEDSANIIDHWHIKKGGYCEMAHNVRQLVEKK